MNNLEFLAKIISDKYGVELEPQDDIFVIGGLDSLDFAELVAELENPHRLSVDPVKLLADWESLRTLEGLASSLIYLGP